MNRDTCLPEGFADLEPFVGEWAVATESGRNAVRRSSSMAQIRALYEAAVPRLDEVIRHLNGFPLDGMPDKERQLLRLALSVMEITPAVELYRQPDVVDAFDARRMEFVVDPAV